MVMVFIASAANDAYGWRWAYRMLGIMVLAVVVPIIIIALKNKPQDMGLVPDGEESLTMKSALSLETAGFTVKEAFGTMAFHLTCLIMALFSLILGGLTMHAIALFRSYGLEEANLMWSLTLGASVLGRIVFGYLADKGSKKFLLGVSWLMNILAFGSIMLIAVNTHAAWGFVLFYGLALGSFVTLLPLFVGERFGVEHFSKLIGLVGLFQVIGLAVGSIVLGRIFDATSSYESAVSLLMAVSILSLAVTVLIGKPRRQPVTSPAL
jgi:MFS family permease